MRLYSIGSISFIKNLNGSEDVLRAHKGAKSQKHEISLFPFLTKIKKETSATQSHFKFYETS